MNLIVFFFSVILLFINICSQNRTYALHSVCEKGYMPVVKLLVDHGAQMNIQNQVNSLNNSALHPDK